MIWRKKLFTPLRLLDNFSYLLLRLHAASEPKRQMFKLFYLHLILYIYKSFDLFGQSPRWRRQISCLVHNLKIHIFLSQTKKETRKYFHFRIWNQSKFWLLPGGITHTDNLLSNYRLQGIQSQGVSQLLQAASWCGDPARLPGVWGTHMLIGWVICAECSWEGMKQSDPQRQDQLHGPRWQVDCGKMSCMLWWDWFLITECRKRHKLKMT